MDMFGNPNFGNRLQLFSSTSFFLAVSEDGSVKGTEDENDVHTHLEIQSVDIGIVKIKGLESNMFICMNEEGETYAEENPENPGTNFKQLVAGSYDSYESVAYPGFFIGIKKTGQMKKGPKTELGQKATKFLPRRLQTAVFLLKHYDTE